jgi:hypothetical protein
MPQLSELSEVRHRVLNEVGDMQPAPGWVLILHRLIFAGLRRKTAIAGLVLVALTSGTLWFHHTPVKVEPSVEPPVELAQIESPRTKQCLISSIAEHCASASEGVCPPTKLDRSEARDFREGASGRAGRRIRSDSQVPMKFFTDDPDIIIYWLTCG